MFETTDIRFKTAQVSKFERLPWTRQEAEAIANEAAQRQVLLALDFHASRELASADTHGFFHAGASQVLATLWPVRDRAYWAAFVLQGDWQDAGP